MPAFAPGKARRLVRLVRGAGALGLASLLLAACTPQDDRARAIRLDARAGTSAYTWVVDHEPSALDVAGWPVARVRPFDAQARVKQVSPEPRRACAAARHDHALLLIVAPATRPDERSSALDCGFALERDATALVIAPR